MVNRGDQYALDGQPEKVGSLVLRDDDLTQIATRLDAKPPRWFKVVRLVSADLR